MRTAKVLMTAPTFSVTREICIGMIDLITHEGDWPRGFQMSMADLWNIFTLISCRSIKCSALSKKENLMNFEVLTNSSTVSVNANLKFWSLIYTIQFQIPILAKATRKIPLSTILCWILVLHEDECIGQYGNSLQPFISLLIWTTWHMLAVPNTKTMYPNPRHEYL